MKWKKNSKNVPKSIKKISQRESPHFSRSCEAKVIYRMVREKLHYCMHSSTQMKTKLCVPPDKKKNNRLRLRHVDNSVIPIQWPFSRLHSPPVPLLRSPSAGLVYCRCDNAFIQSPVTFFLWICVCGHQSGSPYNAVHLVIITEPQLWIKSLHPLQTHIDLILNLINHAPPPLPPSHIRRLSLCQVLGKNIMQMFILKYKEKTTALRFISNA